MSRKTPKQPKNGAHAEASSDDDIITFDVVRFLITLFIVWQLLAVAFWLMPGSAIKRPFLGLLEPYMWVTAGDQNWSMFAPNPASQDVYLTANIVYQNGANTVYTFPRMRDLNYLQRYQQERFRKMIEWAHQDNYHMMWPYLARFAALANNSRPHSNPVVHVELVRHWQDIPNPGVPMPPYSQYTFYKADYPPGSLDQ